MLHGGQAFHGEEEELIDDDMEDEAIEDEDDQ